MLLSRRLPPEIVTMIIREAFPSIIPTHDERVHVSRVAGGTDLFHHRVRDPIDERTLADTIPLAGHAFLPYLRSLLFHAPHVSTRQRAAKLLRALKGSSEATLTALVRRLILDVRPRPLGDQLDRTGVYDFADGITAQQIGRLAELTPEVKSLVVDTSQGGDHWLCGKPFLEALRAFGRTTVTDLEIVGSGLGCQNALHLFADAHRGLRSLKLKNLVPGWTALYALRPETESYAKARPLAAPFPAFARLETLVLWDCTLHLDEFSDLLSSLGPGDDDNNNDDGAVRFPLRHLTLHHIKIREVVPEQTARRCPFPPEVLQAHLAPLVPHLESLHLVLYDRDPIATRARGMPSQLAAPTRPEMHDYRPGDILAALIGPNFRELTLGGPYCVSNPAFFDALDKSANRQRQRGSQHGPGHVRRLTLTQCADRGQGEGITVQAFTRALDREWAAASSSSEELVELDLEGMDPHFEDSYGNQTPLWSGPALDALVNRVEQINNNSRQGGAGEIRLRVNEAARRWVPPRRSSAADERRANARKPPGKRQNTGGGSGGGGGGGSSSKKS